MAKNKSNFKFLWQFLNQNMSKLAAKLYPYLAPSFNSYKTYSIGFSQSGTSNPTATVLVNTTGRTVTWTRVSIGVYDGNFDVPVPIDQFFLPNNTPIVGGIGAAGSYTVPVIPVPTNNGVYTFSSKISGSTVTGVTVSVIQFFPLTQFQDWSVIFGSSTLCLEFRIYN